MNLTEPGYLPADTNQSESYPLCYLDIKNRQFCYSIEIALAMFFIAALIFAYQIWFVWIRCYHYSFKTERRVQIMSLGLLYCVLHTFHQFLHYYLFELVAVILGFLRYQLCAQTVIHYYHKIMNILPEIKDKWTTRLKVMHYSVSFALIVNSIVIFYQTPLFILMRGLDCSLNPFIAF